MKNGQTKQYRLLYVHGHVEVHDEHGFVFSADNEQEALADLALLTA